MIVDVTRLLAMFTNLMPWTEKELGNYCFETVRNDGMRILFSVSLYEYNMVALSVSNNIKYAIAHLTIYDCTEVRILNEKLKQFEILHKNGRCVVDLLGGPIFKYSTLERGNEN